LDITSIKGRKTIPEQTSYSELIPGRSVLNSEAPFVPVHYISLFNINLNTKQKSIGNPEFLNFSENKCISGENTSYKTISSPPHINL